MPSFDSFEVGRTLMLGKREVLAKDMAAFADVVGFAPGSVASARWFALGVQLRILVDDLLNKSRSQGSPGLDTVSWHKDIQEGDTLQVQCSVLDRRESRSRPDIGLVQFQFDTVNQAMEPVVSVRQWSMFGLEAMQEKENPPTLTGATLEVRRRTPPEPLAPASNVWTDWRPVAGCRVETGSYRFNAPEIIDFAESFDPQPFHLSQTAARSSALGSLCASGLHSAAVGAALAARGPWKGTPRQLLNMRWNRPVVAGATIHFSCGVIEVTRGSPEQPVKIRRRIAGVDEAGGAVLEFEDEVDSAASG